MNNTINTPEGPSMESNVRELIIQHITMLHSIEHKMLGLENAIRMIDGRCYSDGVSEDKQAEKPQGDLIGLCHEMNRIGNHIDLRLGDAKRILTNLMEDRPMVQETSNVGYKYNYPENSKY